MRYPIKYGATDPDILTGSSGGPTPKGLTPEANRTDVPKINIATEIKVEDSVTGVVSAGGAVTSGFVNADGKTPAEVKAESDKKFNEEQAVAIRKAKDDYAVKLRNEATYKPGPIISPMFQHAILSIGLGQFYRYLAGAAKAKGDREIEAGNQTIVNTGLLRSGAAWQAAEKVFLDAAAPLGQSPTAVQLSLDHTTAAMFAHGPVLTAWTIQYALKAIADAGLPVEDTATNLPGDMADATTIN
jgi:hypothetical protein